MGTPREKTAQWLVGAKLVGRELSLEGGVELLNRRLASRSNAERLRH